MAEKTEAIVEKENVLRPMPVIEMECKLINMKSFIGAVIQLANGDGDIIDDMTAYGHLLDSMKCNTEWICIGECNKDGIFHVHALAKNNYRTDSWRRSINSAWGIMATNPKFIEQFGTGCTMDCLKCQKAHRASALLEYMTKAPAWILANTDRMLQLAYDMIKWDMGSRFRQQSEPKAPNLDQANPMISDILACILEHNCKTVEEVMRHNPDMVLKYLHRPGFQNIVQNCLTYAKCTKSAWKISHFAQYPCDPSAVHAVLLHQGIDVDRFDITFYRWITKKNGKKNTLCIVGPSNTGKTSFFRGLRQNCPTGEVVNGQNFNYEGLVDCYLGVWDEPLCADEQAEKFKQIAGGEPCAVAVKHKKPYQLDQVPMIITTNRDFWFWCPTQEAMFRNRFEIYNFKYDATTKFFPRSRSTSCECSACKFSSCREASTSSATTSGMSGTKQSQELMAARHDAGKINVGSKSVRRGGKCTSKSPGGRSRGESSSSSQSGSSSSSTISNIRGSDSGNGSSNTGIGVHSSGTGSREYVGGQCESGRSEGHDSGSIEGSERGGEDGHRHNPTQDQDVSFVVPVGRPGRSKSQMEDELQAKKRRMAGELVSLRVPTKEDWRGYLCFLYEMFERKPIDLTCYESLSESSEDE